MGIEDDVRYEFYTRMQAFAGGWEDGVDIMFPNSFAIDDTAIELADGFYIPASYQDNDLFFDVRIVPNPPKQLGLKNGFAEYSWNIQLSPFVRYGDGDLIASRVADELRNQYIVGDRISTEKYTYTITSNVAVRASINVGGWQATPILFSVSKFR